MPQELTQEDFQRIRPQLKAAFSHLGAAQDELEDLIQDSFLQAHLSLPGFQGLSALDTWVVSIGKNVWLHHQREKRALKREHDQWVVSLDAAADAAAPLPGLTPAIPDPEVQTTARQRVQQVCAELARLPRTLRQPLLLRVQGISRQQIGTLLGISPKLVTSRIHQAREQLRQRFPER